jgi:iron complex outermembrane receptor protein
VKKHQGNQYKKSMLALAVLAAFNASAQESIKEDSANKDPLLLEEVYVFGQFQQSMIDRIQVLPKELPFTLNTIDRGFIDDRNFTRAIETLTVLPNIVRTEDRKNTGGTTFLSRGFEAPVLVDNRYQNTFRGTGYRDDSFVERYEVLKGPASITSGPVGGGGIINTVTKSPETERFTTLKVRADEFGSQAYEFDANIGELDGSDTALIRVSGAYRDYDFDAKPADRQNLAIRPVVTINLTDSTKIKASVAYTENKGTPNTGLPINEDGSIPDNYDTDTFGGAKNADVDVTDTLYDLELSHEFLDGLKLTLRGSRQETDLEYKNANSLYNYYVYDYYYPGYGTYQYYYGVSADDPRGELYSWSDASNAVAVSEFYDMQLSYSFDAWGLQQDFAFGVAKANTDLTWDIAYPADSLTGPLALNNPTALSENFSDYQPFRSFETELESVYFESAIRPTQGLAIVAGLRYDDLYDFQDYGRYTVEFDDSALTARLGVSYEIMEELTIYQSYAQGFLPQFGQRRSSEGVEAETSESFELGFKGNALNGNMTYEFSTFYTLRNDVAVDDPTNDISLDETFVVSAGEVSSEGFELSTTITPVTGLYVNFNVGYVDMEIKKQGETNIAADPVELKPYANWTGSTFINYEFTSGPAKGFSVGGGARYVGQKETNDFDWDSTAIADLNFGYNIKEGLDLSLDVLNVFDELYVENSSSNSGNARYYGAVLGAPRTAVISLSWEL